LTPLPHLFCERFFPLSVTVSGKHDRLAFGALLPIPSAAFVFLFLSLGCFFLWGQSYYTVSVLWKGCKQVFSSFASEFQIVV